VTKNSASTDSIAWNASTSVSIISSAKRKVEIEAIQNNQASSKSKNQSFFSKLGCNVFDPIVLNVCKQGGAIVNKNESRDSEGDDTYETSDHNNYGSTRDKNSHDLSADGDNTYEGSEDDNESVEGSDTIDEAVNDQKSLDDTYDSGEDESTYDTMGDSIRSSNVSLSEKERRVWDEWDKKDSQSHTTGFDTSTRVDSSADMEESMETFNSNADTRTEYTEDKEANYLERRAHAHEKLLMHAYAALSMPPQIGCYEKGTKVIHNNECETEFFNKRANAVEKNLDPDIGNKSNKLVQGNFKSTVLQKQILEKFLITLRNNGIEVSKLNRDNKWQTRYLTVSKEGSWLCHSDGNSGDRAYFPLAILWVKKFSTKEYSISNIDKQGKGGIILTQLTCSEELDAQNLVCSSAKKQNSKFADSVIVKLHSKIDGENRCVTFRCSKESSTTIITGCNAIIDVLKST